MKQIFLRGKTVHLRPLSKDDLTGNYPAWFNDPEVCQRNEHGYFPKSFNELEKYVEESRKNRSRVVLAIIHSKDGVHIGNIALQDIDWISRSAAYAIIVGDKKYWGKGLAKEASDLLLRHGFIALNLHRIYCGTFAGNVGMLKLAAYMKMKKEGVRREAFYKNGSYLDILEFGVLRDEYLRAMRQG